MPSSPSADVVEVVADDVGAVTMQSMGLQSSAYSSSSNSFYGAGGLGIAPGGNASGAAGTAANTQYVHIFFLSF